MSCNHDVPRAQALQLVEDAGAMRSRPAREGAFGMLAACALRYGQLEAVAGALAAALARSEHLAAALPELAEYAEARHGDTRLVRAPARKYARPARGGC